jgi:hypothetical protein
MNNAEKSGNPATKEWWNSLDTAWKEVFKKRFKEEQDVDKLIILIQECKILGCHKSEITSLVPIKGFTKLTTLDISGCFNLVSLDHLPINLEYLTMHWLRFNDYNQILSLQKLNKISADKDIQRSLNTKLTKLKKERLFL